MASRKFTIELTLSTKDGIGNYPDAPRIYAGLTQIMAKDPDIWVDCLGGTPYDIVVTDPEGRKQSFGSIKESWGIIGKDEG